jgi:chorismate mutase
MHQNMSGGSTDVELTLPELRTRIEQLDGRLVDLIHERTRLARVAGDLKRAAGAPALDPAREAAVVRHAAAAAREAGLPEEDLRDIFWRLIALARRVQGEA